MVSDPTERQVELLEQVFGGEWPKCVSPRGREELERRVDAGLVEIRTPADGGPTNE